MLAGDGKKSTEVLNILSTHLVFFCQERWGWNFYPVGKLIMTLRRKLMASYYYPAHRAVYTNLKEL